MFYFKTPDTRVLTPLSDAEIVGECPICGKRFEFPELWEMLEGDFTLDCGVWCDDCSAKSAQIRTALENAGLTGNLIDNLITELMKATEREP